MSEGYICSEWAIFAAYFKQMVFYDCESALFWKNNKNMILHCDMIPNPQTDSL